MRSPAFATRRDPSRAGLFQPAQGKKKTAGAVFFLASRSRNRSALTSLETWVALADYKRFAATTNDLAVTVPQLGGLQG
jgi:hypothetical protein